MPAESKYSHSRANEARSCECILGLENLRLLERTDVGVAEAEPVGDGVEGIWAILATTSRKILATKGVDWRKAGRWAHCQSGRVVVDSQSMTQVYEQVSMN